MKARHGPDRPEYATAINNLAQLLQATNRLAEAEPLMRQALAIDEKSFGPEHPDVAVDLNSSTIGCMDRAEHTADDQLLDDAIREDELAEILADVRDRDQD